MIGLAAFDDSAALEKLKAQDAVLDLAVVLARDELKALKAANVFTMKDVLKSLKNFKPPAPPKGKSFRTDTGH